MFYGQTKTYSNLKCYGFRKMRTILTSGNSGKEPLRDYHQIVDDFIRFLKILSRCTI